MHSFFPLEAPHVPKSDPNIQEIPDDPNASGMPRKTSPPVELTGFPPADPHGLFGANPLLLTLRDWAEAILQAALTFAGNHKPNWTAAFAVGMAALAVANPTAGSVLQAIIDNILVIFPTATTPEARMMIASALQAEAVKRPCAR
jgi:hypothetical protein